MRFQGYGQPQDWEANWRYPIDQTAAHAGVIWRAVVQNINSEPTALNPDWIAITGAGSASQFLLAVVDLSSADLATLHSSPVPIIAAPGSGLGLVLLMASSLELDTGSLPFGQWGAVTLSLSIDGVSQATFPSLDFTSALTSVLESGTSVGAIIAPDTTLLLTADFDPGLNYDYQTLYSFAGGTDGSAPQYTLLQAADLKLYGATNAGGAGGFGTIFSIAADGTGYTLVHDFVGGAGGENPFGALIQATDTKLYGVTSGGGSAGQGIVFSINTNGTGFTVLHNFDIGLEIGVPNGGVIQGVDGKIYGMPAAGGTGGTGGIFQMNTNGTGYSVVHNFPAGGGSGGRGALIQALDGKLYGLTQNDVTNPDGSVFQMNPDGTGFTTLHLFTAATDGNATPGTLVQANDGKLYGWSSSGGPGGAGTLFRINTDGTGFTVLHAFNVAPTAGGIQDGQSPFFGALIRASDGLLYGTAVSGGPNFGGLAFRLALDGTGYTAIYGFGLTGVDGSQPNGGMMQATNGRLYGVTQSGGANGTGAVYSINPVGVIGDGSGRIAVPYYVFQLA